MTALLAATLASAAPAAQGPEPLGRSDIPIALVLSGGVSLGSYEAGVSWAVVRFSAGARSHGMPEGLGAPRLVAVTGASAGSVNALLSAIDWCSESSPDDDSVDRNLIREAWMGIGLDALLPEDFAGYAPGDALLSSVPLIRALDGFDAWVTRTAARRQFRPGCRLPIGVTVTRARAEEEELGGLSVRTQRFALPWRLEVFPDGAAHVVSQHLEGTESRADVLEAPHAGGDRSDLSWAQVEQGILASAAFPVAFRARELCDCSAHCPVANRVTSGTCEGPRGPITALSCPARSAEGEPLSLCAHRYVDGGIFDNTPVGLGVELTQAVFAPQPLQPVTYVFIDPDLRRLKPEMPEAPPSETRAGRAPAPENLESAVRLLGELVATSRTRDLSRTLREGSWNITTRGLLYETAGSLVSFAAVDRQVGAALGLAPAHSGELLPRAVPGAAIRAATGQALLRCFATPMTAADAIRRCARELLETAAGRGAASVRRLDDEEVIALAEAMAQAAANMIAQGHGGVRRDPSLFADQMIIGAVGMVFLADEIPRVVQGGVPEARLLRFRGALLETIQLGRGLGADVARLANGVLADELEALAADPALRPAASHASGVLHANPEVLFVPQDLSPVIAALDRSGERHGRLVRELVRFGPVLQMEIVRLHRLSRAADALEHARSERALRLSSRFAPITGSQLANFGAFLDRPFREYDYYAGVYDAAHAIAVAMCEAAAGDAGPPPLRKATAASELDPSAPDTQRCIGRALDAVRRGLDLERSPTAARIFRMLAQAELEASLGAAATATLVREASWSWLGAAPGADPDAAVVTVGEVLLSSRVPCSPGAQSVCTEDLSFEEFVSRLAARGYRPVDANMRALLDDSSEWMRHTARKLVDRSLERERVAEGGSYPVPAVLLAHGVGEMWLRGAQGTGPMPRLDVDSSSIPGLSLTPSLEPSRFVAHLVPYRIDLDVARGGFAVSWLDPTLWVNNAFSIVGQLTPISYQGSGEKLRSSIGLLPTAHVAGVSIGGGPTAAFRWTDGDAEIGACARLSVFQNRFSLEAGSHSFARGDRAPYVAIGVSDLNGAFFWLLRGGQR